MLKRLIAPFVLALVPPLTAGAATALEAVPGPDTGVRAAPSVTVVAAGDIACPPGARKTATTCRQADTAALARSLHPDAVLALGDLQYDRGSRYAFRHSYDRSWGSLKSITFPVPGNHEYKTRGARGYYRYLRDRQPGSPGYYTRTLGSWQVFALNSNCDEIRCRREYRWLRRNIGENPSACSLFMMHHPRFSSGGEHGSSTAMRRFFSIADRHGVELILAGHDHDYERFARMNADGQKRRNGVTEIVSGAGGKSLYRLGPRVHGSVYAEDDRYGVLELTLAPTSFAWAFHTVGGGTPDSGSRGCR